MQKSKMMDVHSLRQVKVGKARYNTFHAGKSSSYSKMHLMVSLHKCFEVAMVVMRACCLWSSEVCLMHLMSGWELDGLASIHEMRFTRNSRTSWRQRASICLHLTHLVSRLCFHIMQLSCPCMIWFSMHTTQKILTVKLQRHPFTAC